MFRRGSQFASRLRQMGRFTLAAALALSAVAHAVGPQLVLSPEPGEYATSKYLVPNEFANYLHYDRLDGRRFDGRPTAVIAVGTLRVFNLAARLRRDVAISLDISGQISQFNREIAVLIERFDRQSFIREILGVEDPSIPVGDRDQFHAAALDAIGRSWQSQGDVSVGFRKVLHDNESELNNWYTALSNYADSDATWSGTFFASDEAYEHIRKVIREGRFYTVTGSLSTQDNMRKVSAFLNESGYVVSEIDLSNAFDYITGYEGRSGVYRLNQNLERLPTTEATQVLLTTRAGSLTGAGASTDGLLLGIESWVYMLASVPEFKKSTQSGNLEKSLRAMAVLNRQKICDEQLTQDQGPRVQ